MKTSTFEMLKAIGIVIGIIIFGVFLSGCVEKDVKNENKEITVFAGAASLLPLKECAYEFEKEYNIKVILNFGSSGGVLSQMKISKQGDIYIPGSQDFMETAKNEGIIEEETEKIVAYLIPTIVVQKGNPKNISSLNDLVEKTIKGNATLGICNPVSCCVGKYAAEVFEKNFNESKIKELKEKIIYAKDCSSTEALVELKQVDAIMGWNAFGKWNSEKVEVIYINVPRIAYIPAAATKFSKNKEDSKKFIDFLTSEKCRNIFEKFGYSTKLDEIKIYAKDAEIGKEYNISEIWYKK